MRSVADRLAERELLDLAKAIAAHHQVTLAEMLGPSHSRGPSWARQALWSELYARGHWSYPRLGELFERHHVTVMLGIRAHLKRCGLEAA